MCICVCLLPIFTLDWICSFTCSYQQLHVHIDSLLSPIFPITVSQIANSPWWALPSILFFLRLSHCSLYTHLLSNTFCQHTFQQFRARWTARSEGIKHSHRESFYVSETLFILMNLTSQNCTFLRNECYNLKAMSRWRKRVSASLLSFFSLRLSPVNDSSVESVTLARPGQMSPEEMARL